MSKKSEAYLNRVVDYTTWGKMTRKDFVKRMFNEGADFYGHNEDYYCVPLVGNYRIDLHKYEYQYFEQLQKEYEIWAEQNTEQIYTELFFKINAK